MHTSTLFTLPTLALQCGEVTQLYLSKYVFVCRPVHWASVQHMAVRYMVSAPWSLLISLTQCSRSPSRPLTSSPLSTFHSQAHTRGRANLLFSVSDLRPVPAHLLLSPSPLH